MKNCSLLRWLALALVLACCCGCYANGKPNFVVIFADDLGYGDLSCFGNPGIRTPELDRMAAEGAKLTDFYVAACVCTPSRAALLTGRLPIRSGMAGSEKTRRVLYPQSEGGLPTTEITIAKALKPAGYATACIGKWHLGDHSPHLPMDHGFDLYFGLPYSNDMNRGPNPRRFDTSRLDPKSEYWNVPLLRGTNVVEIPAQQDTLTRRYTEEAVKFIRENKTKPFFLYFPHTFPHVPLFASAKFKGKSIRGLYGDVIEELDWSVGQVLETLRKEKLDQNTLVIFTSDNGPWLVKNLAGGSAGLLRDGKGSTWEGGMRVPAIAWWPGKIPAGTIISEMASSMDLFPTFLSLAGVEIPKDRPYDGYDLRQTLFDSAKSVRDTMFYYRGDELWAVRKGNYKIHFMTRAGYTKEPVVTQDPPLLFDVAQDPSERFDIAGERPNIVASMQELARKHKEEVTRAEPQY
jgi:arylsulfatase A-like enzyme